MLHRLEDKEFKFENMPKQFINEYGIICLQRNDESKEGMIIVDAYIMKFMNHTNKPTIPMENLASVNKKKYSVKLMVLRSQATQSTHQLFTILFFQRNILLEK